MAEDKTVVDPFDVSFSDDPLDQYPPIKKTKRSPGLKWGTILNPFKSNEEEVETSVPLEEVLTPRQLAEEKRKQAELDAMPDEIDVPEIETHVEDLPEGNENEKELVVEHTDDNPAPSDDKDFAKQIDDILGISGEPQGEVPAPSAEELAEGAEQSAEPSTEEKPEEETGDVGGNAEEPQEEENPAVDEEKEKRKKLMKEMRALAQNPLKGFKYSPDMENWTPKQKQDAIKAWLSNQPKEEPVEEEPIAEPVEEKPKMTKEQAMAEARMLAQDDLVGVDIDPELWSQFSNKEKLDFVKMLQDKDKDNTTNIDEDTTNNYESYKRYPTALRVAEDVAEGVSNIADRVEGASNKNLAGGESIGNAVNRANIPHYDYRSFFK